MVGMPKKPKLLAKIKVTLKFGRSIGPTALKSPLLPVAVAGLTAAMPPVPHRVDRRNPVKHKSKNS